MGVPCVVGATSKMLRPAGDRVKTDKRDALFLARMLAVGNIVEVRVPSTAEEAARDLTRLQEDARVDLTRAKLRLSSFLLRRGIVYGEGKTWTNRYRNWIAGLEMDEAGDELAFREYLAGVAAEQRKARIRAEIERVASSDEYADRVSRIRCIRGINTYTAFSVVVGVGDFSRFPTARSFMSYLGLVPSESSSGESASRGEITRTGNGHARKLLIESAWHHLPRYNPTSPTMLEAMSSAASPQAAAKADKANWRLHRKYTRMLAGARTSAS